MDIDFTQLTNPILDRAPAVFVRDPAVVFHDGVFRCFHTAVEPGENRYRLFLDVTESRDLQRWSSPRRLTTSELGFSSPGNIIRTGGRWTLCVQSYPVPPGELFGSDESRLWLMESDDLANWSDPRPVAPQGCQAAWARSPRQIDPYLVAHDGRYWCFYKAEGSFGLLVSGDLRSWSEAAPDRPVLSRDDAPDGATVENPCIVRNGGEFVMFFAPCRAGRGIGVARSGDLLDWRDVCYLDFPALPWASGGPTAAMVLDLREQLGQWLMFFHGDGHDPHSAALGLAWSDDLEAWHCPGPAH